MKSEHSEKLKDFPLRSRTRLGCPLSLLFNIVLQAGEVSMMAEQELFFLNPLPPPRNNNWAAIHRQKCLCGCFGIQVGDCDAPVFLVRTDEDHFEYAGPCPGGLTQKGSVSLWTWL